MRKYNHFLQLKSSYLDKKILFNGKPATYMIKMEIKFHQFAILCKFWQISNYFFLAASRFGADTLTFPGMFLDRSASWNRMTKWHNSQKQILHNQLNWRLPSATNAPQFSLMSVKSTDLWNFLCLVKLLSCGSHLPKYQLQIYIQWLLFFQ